MDQIQIFGLLSGLLVLAFVANRLFGRTRVPDLIILLLTGVALGPVLKLVNTSGFATFTQLLGNLALILILFEGGLELRLKELLRHFPGGVLLAFLGYGLSFASVSAIAHWTMRFPWNSSLLLGAVFGCTSSTVIMPVLQQMQVREPVRLTLLLESALGDIIGVLMVTGLLRNRGQGSLLSVFVSGLASHVAIAVLLAVAAGLLWVRMWRRISHIRFSNAFSFGIVLGIYAATQAAGGSGLLAVVAFGITIANAPGANPDQEQMDMLNFHSELSFLVRSFFFVLLGLEVEFVSAHYILPTVAVLGALLVSRFVAIQASRFALREMTPAERETVFFMMPRGLITAVLAVEVINARGNEYMFLPAMALTVIVVSNVLLVAGSVRASKTARPEVPAGTTA